MIEMHNIVVGDWITLKGITGHGKNRIREHGDKWLVVAGEPKSNRARRLAHQVRPVRLNLRSENKTLKVSGELHFDGRWVDIFLDKNFEITEIVI